MKIIPVVGADDSSASVWDTLAEGRAKYGPIEDEMELPVRVVSRLIHEGVDDQPSPASPLQESAAAVPR